MDRRKLLAACFGSLWLANGLFATDPQPSESADATSAIEIQQARARELIQQRAAKQSRERQARIEARKRAGISLQRPSVWPRSPAARDWTDYGFVPYSGRIGR